MAEYPEPTAPGEDAADEAPSQTPGSRPDRARPADPVSIFAGLMFLLLGGAYLWGAVGDLRVNASWTISLLMVGLGVCGVIAGATHRR